MVSKHQLTFRVLNDPGNQVASRFGVVYRLPDDLRRLYEQFGVDFKRFNGDDSGTLPMPSRFIVDRQGIILHSEAHPDYTKRPEPAEIINLLKIR